MDEICAGGCRCFQASRGLWWQLMQPLQSSRDSAAIVRCPWRHLVPCVPTTVATRTQRTTSDDSTRPILTKMATGRKWRLHQGLSPVETAAEVVRYLVWRHHSGVGIDQRQSWYHVTWRHACRRMTCLPRDTCYDHCNSLRSPLSHRKPSLLQLRHQHLSRRKRFCIRQFKPDTRLQ